MVAVTRAASPRADQSAEELHIKKGWPELDILLNLSLTQTSHSFPSTRTLDSWPPSSEASSRQSRHHRSRHHRSRRIRHDRRRTTSRAAGHPGHLARLDPMPAWFGVRHRSVVEQKAPLDLLRTAGRNGLYRHLAYRSGGMLAACHRQWWHHNAGRTARPTVATDRTADTPFDPFSSCE